MRVVSCQIANALCATFQMYAECQPQVVNYREFEAQNKKTLCGNPNAEKVLAARSNLESLKPKKRNSLHVTTAANAAASNIRGHFCLHVRALSRSLALSPSRARDLALALVLSRARACARSLSLFTASVTFGLVETTHTRARTHTHRTPYWVRDCKLNRLRSWSPQESLRKNWMCGRLLCNKRERECVCVYYTNIFFICRSLPPAGLVPFNLNPLI